MKTDSSDQKFQFSLRSLLLLTVSIAIVFSTYRTTGRAGLLSVLVHGALVGIVFIIVTREWLRWHILVFCGAMIGGVAGVDIARIDGSVTFMWRDSGIPELRVDDQFNNIVLGAHATFGAVVGGFLSIAIAGVVAAWRPAHDPRPELKPADEPYLLTEIPDYLEPTTPSDPQTSRRDEDDGSRTKSVG